MKIALKIEGWRSDKLPASMFIEIPESAFDNLTATGRVEYICQEVERSIRKALRFGESNQAARPKDA